MDFPDSQYEIIVDKLNFTRDFSNIMKSMSIDIPTSMMKRALNEEKFKEFSERKRETLVDHFTKQRERFKNKAAGLT